MSLYRTGGGGKATPPQFYSIIVAGSYQATGKTPNTTFSAKTTGTYDNIVLKGGSGTVLTISLLVPMVVATRGNITKATNTIKITSGTSKAVMFVEYTDDMESQITQTADDVTVF